MNYNLISPDGEGQKFRVKFQEPIVLPPDAKVSLNYAVFERNSVFDFTQDQFIRLIFTGNHGKRFSDNTNGGMGDIYPRNPLIQDATAGNIAIQKTPIEPINDTNLTRDQNNLAIKIPKDNYTIQQLNYVINQQFFMKKFSDNFPLNAINFFGRKDDGTFDIPDSDPNGLIHLPNQMPYCPPKANAGGIQFGFTKNNVGNIKPIRFSTTHTINSTNVEQTTTLTNSFTPTANNAEYNAYALSRDRLFHFGTINDFTWLDSYISDKGVNRVYPNGNCEGLFIHQSTHNLMLSAETKQINLDGTYDGKDFIGFYSIDYAGLENENQTNGTGLSNAVNTTRKGRDEGNATHTPPTNEVINSGDLKLTTTLGATKEVPKCFFGVEFLNDTTHNKTRMNIYMSPSNITAWRHAEIEDQVLVYTTLLDNLVGISPNVGSSELFVGIHMVENVDKYGKAIIPDITGSSNVAEIYFPQVFLGAKGKATAMCVFDGRFHNLGGIRSNILSGFGGSFLRQDEFPLKTDGLSYRGSDLPFAPIFAGNNTSAGWRNIRGTIFDITNKGTLNNKTDPLRGAYFIREHGYFCNTQLANDLFGLFNPVDDFNYGVGASSYKFFSRPFYPMISEMKLENYIQRVYNVNISNLQQKLSYLFNLKDIPHSYKNDRYTIYINLPTKAFSNIADKSKPGTRKQILSHAPLVFGSNQTDDTETALSGIKVISGGYAPSLGLSQHLDNKHIITTNYFEIEVRNMNDDTPANQLHKTIVNFSVFA